MRALKVISVLLILGGSTAFFWHLNVNNPGADALRPGGGFAPPPTVETPLALKTSASCQSCHPGVYREWHASHHRLAYTNKEVQRLSKQFQNRDCLPCHLPRPVFETGLGVRVLERATLKAEGVNCFTCHLAGHACLGVGPLQPEEKQAPCQPRVYRPLGEMILCAPCHDQHKVHRDWKASRFGPGGPEPRDCNDCHMPVVERGGPGGTKRRGRAHRFPGAHDAAFIRSGVSFHVEQAGRGLQEARRLLVEVKNTGTGHAYPADERHRAVDLEITLEGEGRQPARVRIDRYRNPYRTEFGIKNKLRQPGAQRDYDLAAGEFGALHVHAVRVPAAYHPVRKVYYPESTQIPAGEARSYTLSLPAAARNVVLRLWFRRNPYQPDKESVLVVERRVIP